MGPLLVLAVALTGDPFEGCTVHEPAPGDRAIQCKGLLGSVSHGPASLGGPALIEAALDGVRSGYKGQLVVEDVMVPLTKLQNTSGKVIPAKITQTSPRLIGVRYAALHPKDKTPVLVGRLFYVPHPTDDTRVRIVGCGAATALPHGERLCDAMLVSLLTALPPKTSP